MQVNHTHIDTPSNNFMESTVYFVPVSDNFIILVHSNSISTQLHVSNKERVYSKVSNNRSHSRSSNIRNVLFEVINRKASIIRVPNSEEERTRYMNRNIIACVTGQVRYSNLGIAKSTNHTMIHMTTARE